MRPAVLHGSMESVSVRAGTVRACLSTHVRFTVPDLRSRLVSFDSEVPAAWRCVRCPRSRAITYATARPAPARAWQRRTLSHASRYGWARLELHQGSVGMPIGNLLIPSVFFVLRKPYTSSARAVAPSLSRNCDDILARHLRAAKQCILKEPHDACSFAQHVHRGGAPP